MQQIYLMLVEQNRVLLLRSRYRLQARLENVREKCS